MSRLIISTVGTSLLGNIKNPKWNPNGLTDHQDFFRFDPQKAAAESNALSRLAGKGDELVFLHSDTPEGMLCSEALTTYFQGQGFEARSVRIAGLSYQERGFVQHGLRNFIRLLAGELKAAQRQGRSALINATGGFKAEIAYATAVGLVFHTPVCYIHEMFNDIVTLPATPISWDYSLFAWHSDFFDWIDAEARSTPEVRQRLLALPEQVALLLEDANDGYSYLSPLGEAYLEAFRGRLEEGQIVPVWLSERAKRDWDSYDTSTKHLFLRIIERLRIPEIRASNAERIKGSDAVVMPQGHVNERLFFSERDGKLYVLELTRHGSNYQQLCNRGVSWRDYQDDQFTKLE